MSRGPFDGTAAPPTLRSALGRFATGVTIVTCYDADGESVGLTVNSFTALSLDPPLVLWALRVESPSLASFESAGRFAVNVLGEQQLELSRRFASAAPDKFTAGAWSEGAQGAQHVDQLSAHEAQGVAQDLPVFGFRRPTLLHRALLQRPDDVVLEFANDQLGHTALLLVLSMIAFAPPVRVTPSIP